MKKFFTTLREHSKNIIDFEKKKILPLTKEELKSHQDAKVCIGKYRGAPHSIYNFKFNVPNDPCRFS